MESRRQNFDILNLVFEVTYLMLQFYAICVCLVNLEMLKLERLQAVRREMLRNVVCEIIETFMSLCLKFTLCWVFAASGLKTSATNNS